MQFLKNVKTGHMKKWMAILTLVFTVNISFAQTQLSKVIPASPTAMELTKYMNYPVNLSNGLIQISIPLYEINEGDIKLPITLNYHASGLKPNIRSGSWLGDGWSLNTGPSLSRSINGGADESYYWNFDNEALPSYYQKQQVIEQKKDIALDEFSYSLLNNSGRLYFKKMANDQLRPVLIPISPVKVNLPTANNYSTSINMVDAKGLEYSFGGSETRFKDYVYHNYGSSVLDVPTSWKIKSIFSPLSNRSINFDYSTNITEVPFYRTTDKVVILDDISCQCTMKIPLVLMEDMDMNPKYYNYDYMTQDLQLVDVYNTTVPEGYSFPQRSIETITQNNSYIKKISFSGGYILFTKNEGGRPGLTSIKVYNYQDTLVKQIELIQYAYGYATLQLSEVKISSPGSSEIQKYSFMYNGIVSKDTRSLDKWGYYNAAPNTTLVPRIGTSVRVNNYPSPSEQKEIIIPGGDREPNETAMQEGMLTEITYPTGGKARFIYEAHRYRDDYGLVRLAGGLRIKQIQQVDDAGQKLYRNFNYSVDGNYNDGIGLLNVIPTGSIYPPDTNFIYYRETNCYSYVSSPLPVLVSNYKERVYSETSMVNLFSESGSSVSYPLVRETTSSDNTGINILGEQIHSFNVSPAYTMKYGSSDIVLDHKEGWNKGNQFSTVNRKNGLDTVSYNNYSYSTQYGDIDSNTIIQRYVYKTNKHYNVDENSVLEDFKRIDYAYVSLSTGRQLKIEESNYTVDGSKRLLATTKYEYDIFGNVKKITSNSSKSPSSSFINTTSYAKDILDQGASPTSVYAKMVSNNMVAIPLLERRYKDTILNANLLNSIQYNYNQYNNQFFALQDVISKIRQYSDENKIQFNKYDSYSNILEQQKVNNVKEVYLWGYKSQYPVAKVIGSDFATVNSKVDTALLNNGTEIQIKQQLTNLRNAFASTPLVLVSTYTYIPLIGMTSETDPRGNVFYYEYDSFSRLMHVKDKDGNIIKKYEYHYKNQ